MKRVIYSVAALAASSAPAFAHLNPLEHGSLAAGLSHPATGADHVLAMLAVGLLAVRIGGRAFWALPLAFMAAMAAGFALSVSGINLPHVEPAIIASVIVLGLATAAALPLSQTAGILVAAVFAVFHGNAHGAEIGLAGIAPYAAGFLAATALLHLSGIALGAGLNRLTGHRKADATIRIGGAATAAAGLAMALAG